MTAKLTVRMDKEKHERLKEMAKEDGRSVNQEIIFLINQALIQYSIVKSHRKEL